ncbi:MULTISPECIES: META domain-containing protein [Microbacterium]|uniref:META domain-containing protein n=1 Tax=Microbacterium TaxID=33882 RepID=UPI00278B0A35|nr:MULTISPECIES: META domain-containing protein [Microbacterium]MDQ1076205.1 heat shock protein HslJ [Microbacterium sp. SORGH_AS_0969]MDQ1116442.1 heat shock protein HslJ [Microbacterium testaceum]
MDDDPNVRLELKDDRSALGFDGCNTIYGAWAAGESAATLELDSSTERSCPGDEPLLSLSKSAKISGTTLILFDDEDREIVRLASGA